MFRPWDQPDSDFAGYALYFLPVLGDATDSDSAGYRNAVYFEQGVASDTGYRTDFKLKG